MGTPELLLAYVAQEGVQYRATCLLHEVSERVPFILAPRVYAVAVKCAIFGFSSRKSNTSARRDAS